MDAIDTVSGCENVNKAPGGGGAGGGGAGGAAGGLDFTLKGMTLTVECPAACSVSAGLAVDKATARKLRLGRSARVGGGSKRLKAAGTAKVKLKLAGKGKRVKRMRKAKVTVKTAAGARTASRAVKLGR